MYSTLVMFEEGPQEYISEDLRDPAHQRRHQAASTPLYRGGDDMCSIASNEDHLPAMYEPLEAIQDSPTSPTPEPSSRAPSIAPCHRSPGPDRSSAQPSTSPVTTCVPMRRNPIPIGFCKPYSKKPPRKGKKGMFVFIPTNCPLLTDAFQTFHLTPNPSTGTNGKHFTML